MICKNSCISVGLNYKVAINQQINSSIQASLQSAALFQTLFGHRLHRETSNRLAPTAKSLLSKVLAWSQI